MRSPWAPGPHGSLSFGEPDTLADTSSPAEAHMAKAYWIACYRSISNPAALAEYAKLAGPAIIAGGGRFLARGGTAKTYEAGIDQRTVLPAHRADRVPERRAGDRR